MNLQNPVNPLNTPNIIEESDFLLEGTLIGNAPVNGTIVTVDPLDDTIIDIALIDQMSVGSLAALLSADESTHLRTRWNEIQGRFVDEPRSSVQQADALVSEVIEKITAMFANEHNSLESQWHQGNNVSTEDLRMALQHYRSFFNRLVV